MLNYICVSSLHIPLYLYKGHGSPFVLLNVYIDDS